MADDHKTNTPRSRGDGDAPHMTPVTPAEDARSIMINKVSWGAVLAGVVVALVSQLIINMFGIGIGAASLDPLGSAADNPSASGLSIGAGIWWVASGVIAAFLGGLAAGRLCGQPKESSAAWHGFTAWAASTLIIMYLLTSAVGGLLGGAYRTVANAAGGLTSTVGSVAQSAAPGLANAADPFGAIEQTIRENTGGEDPAALRDAAVASVRAALTGNPQQAQEARERAAQTLARARNVPLEQARTDIAAYEQQYRQTAEQVRQQAAQAADVAASAVAQGALYAAIGLVLGGLAGWFGGRMGTVEPTVTANVGAYPVAGSAPGGVYANTDPGRSGATDAMPRRG